MLQVQRFTFNPVQENTYVLYNAEKECCIIDPGCYFASEEKELTDFISQNGLKPVLLLNTHCHLDHIFGNRFVSKQYNLLLHIHKNEVPILERGPAMGDMWQLPFQNYDGELKFLEEGSSISLGSEKLDILLTPGHSPGSVCFYSREHKFLMGGDVLFQGSVGRTDIPGGDMDTLLESIKTKLYTLPEDVIIYPGHGDSTTIGDEIKTNPFARME
jgi:hydroxyacylglutathione hydrolase